MKDNLYNYLIHYNSYMKLWFAFKREDMNKVFNGDNSAKTYSGKSISAVIKQIPKD